MLCHIQYYILVLIPVLYLDGVQSTKCTSPTDCTLIYKCNSRKGEEGRKGAIGDIGSRGESATQEKCGISSKGDKGEPRPSCSIPGKKGEPGYPGIPGYPGPKGRPCELNTEFFLDLCKNLSVETGPIDIPFCKGNRLVSSIVGLPIFGEKGDKGEPGEQPLGGGLDLIPNIGGGGESIFPPPPRAGLKGPGGTPGKPGFPGRPGLKGERGSCECTPWKKLGVVGVDSSFNGTMESARAVTYFNDIELMKNASLETHPRGTLAYYSLEQKLFIRSSVKWKEIKTIPKYRTST